MCVCVCLFVCVCLCYGQDSFVLQSVFVSMHVCVYVLCIFVDCLYIYRLSV